MRVLVSLLACAATASAFLLPTPTTRPASALFASTVGAKDIVDTAVDAGSFKTLATALTAAGLVETLKGPGPFTVFAPTDEAFNKLEAATLNALLADKEKLTSILTYHVVSGRVPAADVLKLTSAKTVQGGDVAVAVSSTGVKVNNANVVATDVEASNGIIHIIDSVLIPGAVAAPAAASKEVGKSLDR
ncbi:beta-ig-h3 fasciclin [Nannochloropsis gaditana]|uniref:Beta-ig-h3 fasciclin n=1 Tax=Nannochloropsis gaditana TaxID=72520 RepID=W7TSC3_9STRA|nr:beta-ig-h3 fasciclin [Nannochloropsis gaditana]